MARPAPNIHVAVVEEDVVILDLNTDSYLCLPGLGRHLRSTAAGHWTSADPAVLTALGELGLFEAGEPPPPRPWAKPVRSSRREGAAVRGWRSPFALILTYARHGARIKGRTVRRLIERSPSLPLPSTPQALAAVSRHARLFEHWAPFVPGQGECLYRAYLLRAYLATQGLGASWVFGVRTWPFAAHCWLQCGDLVLDDDPDRVGLYTPILVISA